MKPTTKLTTDAIAARMNRPLVQRAKPPSDPAEREASALDGLLSCASSIQRAFMNGEHDLLGCHASECAIFEVERLAARAMTGDLCASADLVHLRIRILAAIDEALKGIPPQSPGAEVAQVMFLDLQVRRARALSADSSDSVIKKSGRRARRDRVGSPRGGPDIDFTTHDNRTVLDLIGRIEAYRLRWSMFEETAEAREKLDPIPAACVALDDFGPTTWSDWHEVGKLMLRTDGKGASSHLKAAWRRLAKVHDSLPATRSYFVG